MSNEDKYKNFFALNSFRFPVLLILASQRIEVEIAEYFEHETLKAWFSDDSTTKRGSTPTIVERCILAWVAGLIWSEIKQLWDMGLREYVNDMWNVIDFVTNSLYVATIALRIVAYYKVRYSGGQHMLWSAKRNESRIHYVPTE